MSLNQNEGFIPVNGGKVWYQVTGNGSGTPLLFLHGGPGFPSYNFACLEKLGNQRPIIIYHQLGCGKSERPTDPNLWKLDRFVDELKIVIETLKLDKVYLLGYSSGAALAGKYSLLYPKKVKSVIFMSPLLSTPKWIEDANRLKATLPEEIQKIIVENEKANTTDSDAYKKAMDEFYKRYWCRLSFLPETIKKTREEANFDVYMTMWGPSEFYCTGNLKKFDISDKLASFKIPILYTCGKYDEATPETVRSFQKMTPHSDMVIFDNSAHHAEIEEEDKFLGTIGAFLKKID